LKGQLYNLGLPGDATCGRCQNSKQHGLHVLYYHGTV